MRARVLPLVVLLVAGCSAGARRPVSCNVAAFEPVVGSGRLGVRLTDPDPRKHFRYVRIDVLPRGDFAGAGLYAADPPHVRRFLATPSPVDKREVVFDFDGRDDAGRLLPPGSYEVGYLIRTEDFDSSCVDRSAILWGRLTTLRR